MSISNFSNLFICFKIAISWLIKNVFTVNRDWYLFQLIVLLKPDSNCWSNFALSWVDRVATGKESFVSDILNLPSPLELVITHVYRHVKKRLTSPLINNISRVFQKLLKYFNGTIILTSFALPQAGVFPVLFNLDLNDLEFAKLSFYSFL